MIVTHHKCQHLRQVTVDYINLNKIVNVTMIMMNVQLITSLTSTNHQLVHRIIF